VAVLESLLVLVLVTLLVPALPALRQHPAATGVRSRGRGDTEAGPAEQVLGQAQAQLQEILASNLQELVLVLVPVEGRSLGSHTSCSTPSTAAVALVLPSVVSQQVAASPGPAA